MSASLKSPLIESYRRENELMSAMIDRLEAIGTEATGSSAPIPPDAGALPSPEPVKEEAPAIPETSVKLPENPREALQEIETALGSFQEQIGKDQGTLRGLKEQFDSTLRHLESREFKALPSLIAFARQWQEKLQPAGHAMEETEQKMYALSQEWDQLREAVKSLAAGPKKTLAISWKEQFKPRMEQVLSAARKAMEAQHRRLKTHEEMIERFCAEARQLAI